VQYINLKLKNKFIKYRAVYQFKIEEQTVIQVIMHFCKKIFSVYFSDLPAELIMPFNESQKTEKLILKNPYKGVYLCKS
jgi:hypothetical protein